MTKVIFDCWSKYWNHHPALDNDADRTWCYRVAAVVLVLAMIVGGLVRFYWVWLVPYNGGPDEHSHYPMVTYIRHHGRPPTMTDVPGWVPVSYPALPPLGYLPCVITSSWCPREAANAYSFARLGNVLIGILTIVAGFLGARELLPRKPEIAIAVAWGLALHPQWVFLNAYVCNDPAMVCAVTLLWWWWIRLARFGPTWCGMIVLGLMASVAVLCKTNAAGAVLAGLPIAVLQLWRGPRWLVLARYFTALATAFLILLPWCVWSWHHHQSWFGLEIHQQWWFAFLERRQIVQGFLSRDTLDDFLLNTWHSFWASFGYCSIHLKSWHYLTISVVTVAALLALVFHLTRHGKKEVSMGWNDRRDWWSAVCSLPMGIFFVLAAHIHHSTHYGYAPQGRYVMPALWAVILLLSWGIYSLARFFRAGQFTPLVMMVFMGWLQHAALRAEYRATHLRQEAGSAGRASGRLLSYLSQLPNALPGPVDTVRPIGEVLFTPGKHGLLVTSVNGTAGARLLHPPTETDTFLVLDVWRRQGTLDGARVEMERGHDSPLVFPLRYPAGGVISFSFDLRSLSSTTRKNITKVTYYPGSGRGKVVIHRFEYASAALGGW